MCSVRESAPNGLSVSPRFIRKQILHGLNSMSSTSLLYGACRDRCGFGLSCWELAELNESRYRLGGGLTGDARTPLILAAEGEKLCTSSDKLMSIMPSVSLGPLKSEMLVDWERLRVLPIGVVESDCRVMSRGCEMVAALAVRVLIFSRNADNGGAFRDVTTSNPLAEASLRVINSANQSKIVQIPV